MAAAARRQTTSQTVVCGTSMCIGPERRVVWWYKVIYCVGYLRAHSAGCVERLTLSRVPECDVRVCGSWLGWYDSTTCCWPQLAAIWPIEIYCGYAAMAGRCNSLVWCARAAPVHCIRLSRLLANPTLRRLRPRRHKFSSNGRTCAHGCTHGCKSKSGFARTLHC